MIIVVNMHDKIFGIQPSVTFNAICGWFFCLWPYIGTAFGAYWFDSRMQTCSVL